MTDWETRYRQGDYPDHGPHPLITRFVSGISPGRALDLACGAGRHALWLAKNGWRVTAVDSSPTAIEILSQRRSSELLPAERIEAVVADLEWHEFRIEPDSYDLIVVSNYLQRDLFPEIRAGVRVGGIVIAVIALVDDEPGVKPMNPAFLLRPGELAAEFAGWDVLHVFEGKPAGSPSSTRAAAEIVARRSPA